MCIRDRTVTLDGDNYSFFFTKTGGIEEKGAGLTGKYNKVLYKYGKKIKADADDKYLVCLLYTSRCV